jgi:hypothetical protein
MDPPHKELPGLLQYFFKKTCREEETTLETWTIEVEFEETE